MTEDIKPKKSTTRKKYEKNPFLANAVSSTKIGTRKLTNSTGDKMMIVSEETGEVVAPAGFHQVVEVDKTQFVKLYIAGVKAFQGLKTDGTAVFELIYRAVQEQFGQDELYLSYSAVDQEVTPMSESKYFRGMKELVEKGFIAASVKPHIYFLNVDYMFSGNRLAFIREFRLKDPNAKPKKVDTKTRDMFAGETS